VTRCKDCDRDMEEGHDGKPRCFACDPGDSSWREPSNQAWAMPELVHAARYEDTRGGLKRPVKP
jgi:hypothetical protein